MDVTRARASIPSSLFVSAARSPAKIPTSAANIAPSGFATNAIMDLPTPVNADAVRPNEPGNSPNLSLMSDNLDVKPDAACLALLVNLLNEDSAWSTSVVSTFTL